MHDFCRKYHEEHGKTTRIITDGQALLILSTTLEKIKDKIPFFFTRGHPSPGTLKDLYELRSILSQRVTDFSSHPLISKSEKCRQISYALTSFKENLQTEGLLDNTALIEWVIRDISERKDTIFSSVRTSQLLEIMPREKKLMLAIRNHAKEFRFEYPAGLDSRLYAPPDWIEPREIVRTEPTDELVARSDIFTSSPIPDNGDGIRTRVFPSTREELESIAEEIHVLAEEGVTLNEICIAFPKISSASPQIQEVLDEFGIPSYSQVGEPLIREPIIGFFLLFPSLVLEDYPRELVISLLSSPYCNLPNQNLPQITALEFDLITRTAGIEGETSWEPSLLALKDLPEDAKKSLPGYSEQLIDPAVALIQEIQQDCNQFKDNLTGHAGIAIYQRISEKWVKPEFLYRKKPTDDPIITREKKAYGQFQGCLKKLSTLFLPDEKIELSEFVRFLTFLLEEPVNLTEDTGGVRISGLRQAVGMEYSCMFLGGLSEGDIPYPSTRFPLLTSTESQELGSRGLDEVIIGEQYYFISTLAAGKKVWLSTSNTRGERKVLTSSFFEEVRKVKNTQEWGRDITHSEKRAAIRAGKTIRQQNSNEGVDPDNPLSWLSVNQTYGSVANRILIEDWYRTGTFDSKYDGILSEDEQVISWLSDPNMFGPERIWSPTQIETYANCPFKFFLERVIRIRPFLEVDPTLSPARKGTLIHDTLCEFFKEWCNSGPRRIRTEDMDEASDLLLRIGKKYTGSYSYKSPIWHATVASLLGYDDNPGLLRRLLDHEAEREGFLHPERFEFEIKSSPDSPDNNPNYVTLDLGEGENIRIQGRIDRIDTTPDGYFAIIDYKTGSQYPNGKRISEGKALQLPLYLLALEKMYENTDKPRIGIGGSYLEISRKIKQTWPLLDPERKHIAGHSRARGTTGFHDVTKGALAAAQQYINGMRAGVFPLPQDRCTISSYCPYSGICRFDRFRNAEQSEEGGEDGRD